MNCEYGVTIIKENDEYWIEVDNIKSGKIVKSYDDNIFSTFQEAEKFVKSVVEQKWNIVSFHIKDLMDN